LKRTQFSLNFFKTDLGRRLFKTHFFISTEWLKALKNFPKKPVVSTDYTSEMTGARIEPNKETGGYFFRAD